LFELNHTMFYIIHWDHISAKTDNARPLVENATFSRCLQSHLPRHSFGLLRTPLGMLTTLPQTL